MKEVTLYTVEADAVPCYGLSDLKYLAVSPKLKRCYPSPSSTSTEPVYLGTEITVPIVEFCRSPDSPLEYFAVSPELREILEVEFRGEIKRLEAKIERLEAVKTSLKSKVELTEQCCESYMVQAVSFSSAGIFKRLWLAITRKGIYV